MSGSLLLLQGAETWLLISLGTSLKCGQWTKRRHVQAAHQRVPGQASCPHGNVRMFVKRSVVVASGRASQLLVCSIPSRYKNAFEETYSTLKQNRSSEV